MINKNIVMVVDVGSKNYHDLEKNHEMRIRGDYILRVSWYQKITIDTWKISVSKKKIMFLGCHQNKKRKSHNKYLVKVIFLKK